MTQIRTAEEVLINHSFEDEPFNNALKERIILCMQEYAKQFIDMAAESAEADCILFPGVDKESILKIKDLIK